MECKVFGPRATGPADRIALRGVRILSRLSGMSQRTTVEQTYVNLEPGPIEAVYTFPLPESAAVCGFEVITGDHVLTGQVEEADRAVERYEEAVGDGHAAYMVEENRPDVFTVRVGNLKPNQAVTIRLTYVCALDRADAGIRVAFPTTVAPRYVSGAGTDPLTAAVDGDALNPPHVLRVPYGLTMEVDVDLGRPLKGIASPSHALRVQDRGGRRAMVTLAGGVAEMDRDVVLEVALHKEHEPVVQAAAGKDGASFLAVTFLPEFDEDDLVQPEPVETVFVLDCSGSMQGGSIAQATAALELCLRSLAVGDTFNVCRFGSTFELMSSEPLHYSQQTLDAAVYYVRNAGDLGGTELHAALGAVMSPAPKAGSVRQVIVLTDGQVSNEPALLELARSLRSHNRIFSFGIGSACSTSLVRGLARATGGAAEFISAGERIEDKVLRTFGRLNSPAATGAAIDWDGCDVQTLAELPPVFDGDVMTVFGRAPGRLPGKVTLSCRTPRGPRQWAVTVPPAAADDGGVIATMWARRMIQSLEEVNHVASTRYRHRKASRPTETLIGLSKEFGLLCSLTTFIAIEHRSPEERNDGRPALRRVPVMLAKGWGAIAGGGASHLDCLVVAAPLLSARTTIDKTLDCSALYDHEDQSCDLDPAPGEAYSKRPARSFRDSIRATRSMKRGPSATKPADELQAVLASLTAQGAFEAGPELEAMITAAGRDPDWWREVIAHSIPVAAGGLPHRDAIVTTVMVLLLLRDRFAAREPMWRRAAGKALGYLARAVGHSAADVRAWMRELEGKLLSPEPARP